MASPKSKPSKQVAQQLARATAVNGLARARHFAAGGTTRQWNMRTQVVTPNQRATQSRDACRNSKSWE